MNLEHTLNLPAPRPQVNWSGRWLLNRLQRARVGRLSLVFPGGRTLVTGGRDGPRATLVVRRPARLVARVLRGGAVGFFEAYRARDWSSPNLPALLEWMVRNLDQIAAEVPRIPGLESLQRLQHRLRANSRRGSRRNIAFHYDLGNEFYRLWLDATMSYSSALFTRPEEAFEDAQRRKYRRLLGLLEAEPGQHILEIGCGWGGFCEEAARAGYRVTGITLSREQLEYAQRRIHAAGLSERVELRLQDYRDVTEQYDHIVSIEMFEAVGEAYWPTYFTTLRERLRPGGRAALQVITIDDQLFPRYRRQADFIQLHIFPGGMLPSPGVFREQLRRAGLRAARTDFFGGDYAETLRRWHRQFRDRRFEVRDAGFDDEFLRTWRYYLAYCEAGFRTGRIDLMQTLIERA